MKLRWMLVVVLAPFACLSPAAQTPKGEHWVVTWATAEELIRPAPPANPPAQPPPGSNFKNQTVRMIVRTSLAGHRLRIKLSNAFGGSPVTIGAAHIALRVRESEIVPKSDRVLTFSGRPDCLLSAGVLRVSDPVDLDVPPLTDLAITLYFPGETGRPTTHGSGLHTTYISKEGDFTGQMAIADPSTTYSYYFLSAVDVLAPEDAGAIVTFGDSITDGTASTRDANRNWPSLLAARLTKDKKTTMIGVANVGIGGNRVLYDGSGASALARLDRDALTQSGVKWILLLEGINDIGRVGTDTPEAPTADDLIAAYKQIIERAHSQGIKVMGCTLTPYEGAKYALEAGEAIRETVNNFIRTSSAFDAVADFEAATRDPANPKRFRPAADSGDHLHPGDGGYQMMADSVDLSVFAKK